MGATYLSTSSAAQPSAARRFVFLNQLTNAPQKPINENRRFALLALGCFGSICCSFAYTFDLVANPIQERYNLTQREMGTVSTASMIALYFALPYAFIYDYLGPMPLCFLAVGTYTIGSLLVIQGFTGGVNVNVASLCVFFALMNTGNTLFSLTSLMVVLSYFPAHKGMATAIVKSFVALGSVIASSIYVGFFNDHPTTFLYCLLIIALAVGMVMVVFLHLPSYHVTGYERQCILIEEDVEDREALIAQYLRQKLPRGRMIYGFSVVIFLIVFLPMQSSFVSHYELGPGYTKAFAVISCIAMFSICGIIIPWEKLRCPSWCCAFLSGKQHKHQREQHQQDRECDSRAASPPLESSLSTYPTLGHGGSTADTKGYCSNCSFTAAAAQKKAKDDAAAVLAVVETEVDYVAPQYKTSFLQNLLTPDLWALWWTVFCFGGTESVIMYNATYIGAALHSEMPEGSHRVLLTVFRGIGSAIGRLLMSYFEYWSQHRRAEDRIPITVPFLLPSFVVVLALVLFLVLPSHITWLACFVAGLGGGLMAVALPIVTRTMYAKDDAKHYAFVMGSYAFAAVAFNLLLYGQWIANRAEKQGRDVCYGRECIVMPLVVMVGLCFSTFFTSGFIHWRYKRYCQLVLGERRLMYEPFTEDASTVVAVPVA